DELLIRFLDLQVLRDQFAKRPLLVRDAALGGDYAQAELFDDPIVLVEDLALEDPEALDQVRAPAHVHASLVEFQLDAPRQEAIGRDLDRHAEVDREVGACREAVELAHPASIDAA